jgi:predicted DNA-binding transcriptional regulator AlpA
MAHKRPKEVENKSEVASLVSDPRDPILISGPSLRRLLDISAVTLWRWRNDEKAEFPTATIINGRLYFPWAAVQAWLDKQRDATLNVAPQRHHPNPQQA